MGVYGKLEVQWYQITEQGAARLQSGQYKHMDVASQNALEELGRLGGYAEWDELKTFGTKDSPMVTRTALRRLIDVGYVEPVGMQGGL